MHMESIIKWFSLPNIIVLSVLVLLNISCDKDDENDNIEQFNSITLSGENEVPEVATTGTGTFNGTYNKDTKILSYTVNWTLGESSEMVTAMHFHGPASPEESAGPVIHITGFPTTKTGTYSGSTPALTTDQEAQLLDGKWYINIHSDAVPAGEIRGNLLR